ncbi:tRNA (adenosine(37)-N6)-dimethylallyltransferase MiaA [Acuticoccus sediminis]
MTTIMAVLIAGPTASGKSHLALTIADRLGGTIINADSMQVYRDLRVLTARPGAEDEARVPHRLYGHVDAAEATSVARWLGEAGAAIAAARAEGRVPIIVGGTGLYLAALTTGLSPMPEIPEAVRRRWREAQAAETPEALHGVLAARDPATAARLRPSDPQRIVRALEVVDATGRSLTDWQEERTPPVLPPGPGVARFVVAPARDLLRQRIADRFDAMMDEGAVEEAVALTARRLDPALPAMKAIGVAQLSAHAMGLVQREEAVADAVNRTRQYAKRQETWFRHRFADWHRLAPGEVPDLAVGPVGPAST